MKRSLIFMITILAAPVAFGEWVGSITSDKSTGILYTKAQKGQSPFRRNPYELVVQCSANEPVLVSIAWDEYFPDAATEVTLSFDGNVSLTKQATTHLNRSAASSLLPDGNNLIPLLKKSNTLVAWTGFWRGKRLRKGEFSLKGFTRAFNQYCGWHGKSISAGTKAEQVRDIDAAIAFLDGPILIEAAAKGDLNTVKAMIKKGVKTDYRPIGKNTALMEASANGYREIVQFLLTSGADPELRNKSGQSAVDLARAAGHPEIVKMLR